MSDINEKIYSDDKLGVTTYKCPNCGMAETEFEPFFTKNALSLLR